MQREGGKTQPPRRSGRVVMMMMTHIRLSQFLDFSRQRGNDLVTPRPEFSFPGLKVSALHPPLFLLRPRSAQSPSPIAAWRPLGTVCISLGGGSESRRGPSADFRGHARLHAEACPFGRAASPRDTRRREGERQLLVVTTIAAKRLPRAFPVLQYQAAHGGWRNKEAAKPRLSACRLPPATVGLLACLSSLLSSGVRLPAAAAKRHLCGAEKKPDDAMTP